jgi:hypothetical protein
MIIRQGKLNSQFIVTARMNFHISDSLQWVYGTLALPPSSATIEEHSSTLYSISLKSEE